MSPVIEIRRALQTDREQIEAIYQSAFPPAESNLVTRVAIDLLQAEPDPEIRSFVATKQNAVVGHIAFSRVTSKATNETVGSILAPLAITPTHQKNGIGSQLIHTGIESLKTEDCNLIFVYGDPAYYSRFGFHTDTAALFTPPYKLQFPHGWQALVINQRAPNKTAERIQCVPQLNRPQLW